MLHFRKDSHTESDLTRYQIAVSLLRSLARMEDVISTESFGRWCVRKQVAWNPPHVQLYMNTNMYDTDVYIYVKYGPRIPGAPVNRMQGVRSVTLTGDASRAESSRHRAADDRLRDLCNYIMNHRIAEIAITSIIEVRRISRPTWRPHWHTPRRGGQPVGSSVGHDGPGLKERLERAADAPRSPSRKAHHGRSARGTMQTAPRIAVATLVGSHSMLLRRERV